MVHEAVEERIGPKVMWNLQRFDLPGGNSQPRARCQWQASVRLSTHYYQLESKSANAPLVFWPSTMMTPITTAAMRAIITAYSMAMAPFVVLQQPRYLVQGKSPSMRVYISLILSMHMALHPMRFATPDRPA